MRMASEIVVGVYDSRRDTDAAHTRLREQGIAAQRITIEEGAAAGTSSMPPGDRFAARAVDEPLREDRGLSGFIGRMFSGALMDDANVEQYLQALRNGQCVIAVRTESDAESKVAASVLARSGPRIYSLANAPTAWNEATQGDPASIGGVDHDPARPEGLLGDAEGLSASNDRARLAGGPRAPRNR
jgi:hypothetical protein